MNKSCRVFTVCAILAVAFRAAFAGPVGDKPFNQPIPSPATWVAFLGEFGGNGSMDMAFANKAPKVIVYADGTVVWADTKKLYAGMSDDPAAWQIGKITKAQVAKLLDSASALNFYTIKPTPPPTPAPGAPMVMMAVSDGTTTKVGFQSPVIGRIVSVYALGMTNGAQSGSDDYSKAMETLRDELIALKPANSVAYVPATISVATFAAYGTFADSTLGTWPLTVPPPHVSGVNTASYTGSDVEAIIGALAKSAYLKFDGAVYHVVWTPAIAMPTIGGVVHATPLQP